MTAHARFPLLVLGRVAALPRAAERAYRVGMRHRRRMYAVMMGTCLTLFVLAWSVVRLFSPELAVAMSVVALVIPPFAAIVGNRSDDEDD